MARTQIIAQEEETPLHLLDDVSKPKLESVTDQTRQLSLLQPRSLRWNHLVKPPVRPLSSPVYFGDLVLTGNAILLIPTTPSTPPHRCSWESSSCLFNSWLKWVKHCSSILVMQQVGVECERQLTEKWISLLWCTCKCLLKKKKKEIPTLGEL